MTVLLSGPLEKVVHAAGNLKKNTLASLFTPSLNQEQAYLLHDLKRDIFPKLLVTEL